MIVKEAIKECDPKELLQSTIKLLEITDGYILTLPEIITGSVLIISKFVVVTPSFNLSKKYKLVFRCDGFGPYCLLQSKGKNEDVSKFNFFKKNKEQDQVGEFKQSDLLYLPWSEIAGLECEFTNEVNGKYLEHLFAYFFLDMSYFGFLEPTGEIVDRKLKNLLDLP